MAFDYQFIMAVEGTIVAKGIATAVMTYEFQKTFIETIGTGFETHSGSFVRLEELLNMVANSHYSWSGISVDKKRHSFRVERVH